MQTLINKHITEIINNCIIVYAERINASPQPIKVLNNFDYKVAILNIIEKMMMEGNLRGKEVIEVNSDEFKEKLKNYIKENLIVQFLVINKNTEENIIRNLIRDKGTYSFSCMKGYLYNIEGKKSKTDQKCTEPQIQYLKTFNVKIKNEEELTRREADQIIKCLKESKRVKPLYYFYYLERVN